MNQENPINKNGIFAGSARKIGFLRPRAPCCQSADYPKSLRLGQSRRSLERNQPARDIARFVLLVFAVGIISPRQQAG
jgi:hypothetical protein